MLRSRSLLLLVLGALLAPGAGHAAVTVFQDPNDNLTARYVGVPGAPASQIVIGAPPVALTLWYQNDGTASTTGTPCLSGNGGEVCGWDIYVAGTGGMVLGTFTPDTIHPGSDNVGAVTTNI